MENLTILNSHTSLTVMLAHFNATIAFSRYSYLMTTKIQYVLYHSQTFPTYFRNKGHLSGSLNYK